MTYVPLPDPKKPKGLPSQMTCPVCLDKYDNPNRLIDCMAGHIDNDYDKAMLRLKNVGLLTQQECDDYRKLRAHQAAAVSSIGGPPAPAKRA